MNGPILSEQVAEETGMSRRAFLQGAGFLLGFSLTGASTSSVFAAPTSQVVEDEVTGTFAPNGFIRINPTGAVTLVMPMVEMGQGVYTSLSMLLAEELEVKLDKIQVQHAPPNHALYVNSIIGIQNTGGSASVRAFWTPLRQAGAVGRNLLIAAAAKRWNVDPATCRAKDGIVFDASGAKHLSYGELATAAAKLPVPPAASVKLKEPKDFTLIGTRARRVDSSIKVDGRALYGIDTRLPGMKVAAVAISPVLGGKAKAVDEKAALAVKGVRQVVNIDEAVAVVADHMGAAKKGLEAAAITWDDGPNGKISNADIVKQLEEASKKPGAVARNDGDAEDALAAATQRVDAIYQVPFLAHAAMEPMNCTVHQQNDRCDIWVGTQAPTITQSLVAELTGLPKEAIKIHNHLIGGGFGRRLEADGTVLAVKIAKHVDGPVKVIWSREEDIQHDMYRPYYLDRLSAGLDAAGKPVAWTHRIAGSSVMARYYPPYVKHGLDPDAVEAAAEPPYALPNIHVDFVRVEPPGVRTSWWRGVGPTHNVFVVESFIDELAHAAKQDPVTYRKGLLGHNPRALAVLSLAAEKAGWASPLPVRHGRGISVQFAYGSYTSQVAEVEVAADGSVKVKRIVCALDCGMHVNPDTIEAQVQGGTLFGLTAALHGSITFKDGRVEQSNFDNYLPMRIDEVPVVETHLIKNAEAPGGVGEAPTAIVSAAVTNAIFAATGKRVRSLPIDTNSLKSSS
ncbi:MULTISPECIES: xanthine dehydrogenase family protein molybdopterin-binding subunit [Bradyrhizobium]|uniref:xanthine dehydrogenase family protein molybdopterin-binding subunit n=1 Tax=Bradyrhizobium TaxID=374 RepID=UPI000231CE85|nr:xanthine dehydrogenase family protein molybdopterin-binding subunit [Bradyrhizobium japonicum]AJA61713.1 aldehyde dehydrogenase [Bradyrhizobium japonicum]KMK01168.1 aldehyde dehydrogenase [Bradyrhizobium japonicum]MBR0759893.1 xanthine dehydrogenase family protein molybdopterin-binding subunit [Bradyrhizobium japonicum]MCS3541983.1 isoquinoline 1-oxidoreductase beta subunit [Bradyrhizobium japonicum]MCS3990829.1 isoquinoline 1-oxidoreductase beta subunit [Bradyrhizobium japonicum]